MNDIDRLREQVSALADGQLQADEAAQAIGQVCAQDELRGTWRTYHLVGEVLRSGSHVACSDPTTFIAGFRERLASEALARPAVAAVPEASYDAMRGEAANEPVFRWKLVAGVASLAAAAAIGWNWVGTPAPAGAQLAQQGAGPALVSAPANPAPALATRVYVGENKQPQVMLRDPRLDALLEAHQQAGGASQMPAGFLRNATFEGPAR